MEDLRHSMLKDFQSDVAYIELQVIGLISKLITGPWMNFMYQGADNPLSYTDFLAKVFQVIERLKAIEDPVSLLAWKEDCFGQQLDKQDLVLAAVQQEPRLLLPFKSLMESSLTAIVAILQRKYAKLAGKESDSKFVEETAPSRSHNIDAESVMGMLSAAVERAPNANVSFISAKIRAPKNKTTQFLDALPEPLADKYIRRAICLGEEVRRRDGKLHIELLKKWGGGSL